MKPKCHLCPENVTSEIIFKTVFPDIPIVKRQLFTNKLTSCIIYLKIRTSIILNSCSLFVPNFFQFLYLKILSFFRNCFYFENGLKVNLMNKLKIRTKVNKNSFKSKNVSILQALNKPV